MCVIVLIVYLTLPTREYACLTNCTNDMDCVLFAGNPPKCLTCVGATSDQNSTCQETGPSPPCSPISSIPSPEKEKKRTIIKSDNCNYPTDLPPPPKIPIPKFVDVAINVALPQSQWICAKYNKQSIDNFWDKLEKLYDSTEEDRQNINNYVRVYIDGKYKSFTDYIQNPSHRGNWNLTIFCTVEPMGGWENNLEYLKKCLAKWLSQPV